MQFVNEVNDGNIIRILYTNSFNIFCILSLKYYLRQCDIKWPGPPPKIIIKVRISIPKNNQFFMNWNRWAKCLSVKVNLLLYFVFVAYISCTWGMIISSSQLRAKTHWTKWQSVFAIHFSDIYDFSRYFRFGWKQKMGSLL